MQTVAEGVETEEQLKTLAASGCSEAQGFYFSQPKPRREIFPAGPAATPPHLTKRAS
jgi:EAL domain-containing protein (putative c-di-GMP-specific phosphodiesterase class I)